jgi:hypothetical protein
MARRAPCLTVQTLSDRIVPAFDLAIDGDFATSNVNSAFAAGTTTFTATGSGARLDVADIATALTLGNVVITTGSGGSQAGDVSWALDSSFDDLSYFGDATRTLTVRPSASATGGDVSIDGVTLAFDDNLILAIDTTAPTATDGNVAMTDFTSVFDANEIVVTAGGGDVQLPGFLATGSGPISVSGNDITSSSASVITAGTSAAVSGAVDVSNGSLTVQAGTSACIDGSVDGAGGFTVGGATVDLAGSIGATTPVNSVTFASGTVNLDSNTVSAGTIAVGDGDPFAGGPAVLGVATGAVTGDVTVNVDGVLAPGGVAAAGTLAITGNLTFDGGAYSLNLGPTTDQVTVSGDVTILAGTALGDADSTGVLNAADGVKKIIDFGGSLTGEFNNAPAEGAKFLLGSDALELGHYGPAANGVTVRQAGREANNTATGSDGDGTGYTIKMTGPGDLVRARDAFGGLILILRNTTDKSSVTVSTKVNASDDQVALSGVSINGRLGAFNAKKVNLEGPLTATGPVKSLAFASVVAPITLGGGAADKTSLAVGAGFGDITTPGTLSITATREFGADVNANAVGAVKVGGTLFGTGADWDVATGITSLTAAEIQGLTINAASIGSVTATGGGPNKVAGDIANSAFVLTGSSGGFGLKTLTAKANVRNSRFDVLAGGVSAVTVGRFIDSQLYIRYTPGLDLTTGSFTGEAALTKFTTTAKVIGDTANPMNWAFAGSQVAAPTLGTVRLSGLKTVSGADPVGFKFSTAGGSVQTTTSDALAADVPLKANLTPDQVGTPDALSGDFFYFDATP